MRRYLAEFLAAFFLVFAGVGAIVADQQLAVVQVRDSFGPLGVALAHGLALAVAIAAVARISGGHANPAVSLAFFVTGRINAKDMLGYVGSQLLGGVAAAFLIKRLFLAQAVEQTGVGVPALGDQMTLFQGIAIEIVLTFLLVVVIWGVAVDRKGPKNLAPLAIGLVVTVDILIGAPFTGAAMNPARWLGPALASGQFSSWPVWLVGPTVGALLAALFYEAFFLTTESDPALDDDRDDIAEALTEEESEGDFKPSPSPMVPPSDAPKPAGEASPMTPPPGDGPRGPAPAPPAAPPAPTPVSPAASPPPPPPPPVPQAPESPPTPPPVPQAPEDPAAQPLPPADAASETKEAPEQAPAPRPQSPPGDQT